MSPSRCSWSQFIGIGRSSCRCSKDDSQRTDMARHGACKHHRPATLSTCETTSAASPHVCRACCRYCRATTWWAEHEGENGETFPCQVGVVRTGFHVQLDGDRAVLDLEHASGAVEATTCESKSSCAPIRVRLAFDARALEPCGDPKEQKVSSYRGPRMHPTASDIYRYRRFLRLLAPILPDEVMLSLTFPGPGTRSMPPSRLR